MIIIEIMISIFSGDFTITCPHLTDEKKETTTYT